MSHEHNRAHGHHNHQTHPKKNRPIHHDWRFWTSVAAVVLMLVAMGVYVMSDDDSLQPGGSERPAMPAIAE